MKRVFLVPQALLEGFLGVKVGSCHALAINDTESLLIVDHSNNWIDRTSDDWLLAQPGVVELHRWDEDKPAPASFVTALSKSPDPATAMRAATASTLRQALRALHPLVRF